MVKLELEAKRLPGGGQHLDPSSERSGRASPILVLPEQHRRVDNRARLLRRESLQLPLADEPMHVAKERLRPPCRSNPDDDLCWVVAWMAERMANVGGYGRFLAGPQRRPLAILKDVQGSFENLEALLCGRMHMRRRPGHVRIKPERGLEQLARGVLRALGDLPPLPESRVEVKLTIRRADSFCPHPTILPCDQRSVCPACPSDRSLRVRGARGPVLRTTCLAIIPEPGVSVQPWSSPRSWAGAPIRSRRDGDVGRREPASRCPRPDVASS